MAVNLQCRMHCLIFYQFTRIARNQRYISLLEFSNYRLDTGFPPSALFTKRITFMKQKD